MHCCLLSQLYAPKREKCITCEQAIAPFPEMSKHLSFEKYHVGWYGELDSYYLKWSEGYPESCTRGRAIDYRGRALNEIFSELAEIFEGWKLIKIRTDKMRLPDLIDELIDEKLEKFRVFSHCNIKVIENEGTTIHFIQTPECKLFEAQLKEKIKNVKIAFYSDGNKLNENGHQGSSPMNFTRLLSEFPNRNWATTAEMKAKQFGDILICDITPELVWILNNDAQRRKETSRNEKEELLRLKISMIATLFVEALYFLASGHYLPVIFYGIIITVFVNGLASCNAKYSINSFHNETQKMKIAMLIILLAITPALVIEGYIKKSMLQLLLDACILAPILVVTTNKDEIYEDLVHHIKN